MGGDLAQEPTGACARELADRFEAIDLDREDIPLLPPVGSLDGKTGWIGVAEAVRSCFASALARVASRNA